MSAIINIAKSAWPVVKPIVVKVGKEACVGVLGSLASKYAYRITGNFILSQRDKDIREAAEALMNKENK